MLSHLVLDLVFCLLFLEFEFGLFVTVAVAESRKIDLGDLVEFYDFAEIGLRDYLLAPIVAVLRVFCQLVIEHDVEGVRWDAIINVVLLERFDERLRVFVHLIDMAHVGSGFLRLSLAVDVFKHVVDLVLVGEQFLALRIGTPEKVACMEAVSDFLPVVDDAVVLLRRGLPDFDRFFAVAFLQNLRAHQCLIHLMRLAAELPLIT